MSNYGKYARNIAKNKLPYENWNQFYTTYKKSANVLAGTQFTLNFATLACSDASYEEGMDDLAAELGHIVWEMDNLDFVHDTGAMDALNNLRANLKNRMDCLVTYTDHFMLYQYVMNCMKYRFEDYDYDDYDDEEFAKELLNYITSDKDQSLTRYKTMEVIKSLPIRMTRSRFFEMVKDGFSVYKGGDSDTLESFNYMIKGAAMLYEPENMEENFPDLYEYDQHFRELDFDSLDSEKFYKENIALQECIEFLNRQISACQIISETTNEFYAFYLTHDYAGTESENYKTIREILIHLVGDADDGVVKNEYGESVLSEYLTGLLMKLEGVQEVELDDMEDADGHLDDICQSNFAAMAPDQIKEEMDEIDCISKLLSTSYFADLDDEDEVYELSESEVSASFGAFRLELEPILKKVPKLMSRALMAAVIGYLPMNFHDSDELYEYIYNSLRACTSLPEKMALVEHLEEIMDDADDWE